MYLDGNWTMGTGADLGGGASHVWKVIGPWDAGADLVRRRSLPEETATGGVAWEGPLLSLPFLITMM